MKTPMFWMVLGSKAPPNFRHQTKADAATEAARLARLYRGETFYILEAVASCVASELTWEDLEPIGDSQSCDVPF